MWVYVCVCVRACAPAFIQSENRNAELSYVRDGLSVPIVTTVDSEERHILQQGPLLRA